MKIKKLIRTINKMKEWEAASPSGRSELPDTSGSRLDHSNREDRIEIAAKFIKDEKARNCFYFLATVAFPNASIAWDTEMEEAEVFEEDWSITFS